MKLGGMTPMSLSDWPGTVAAVVFTQGCNFRCPFCHNPELIPAESSAGSAPSEGELFDFLQARRGRIDGVVVSGGEPTIQDDLPRFFREIRNRGFAVKLDTNGSLPEVIRRLLADRLLDFVAMDVKAPLEKYDALTGVRSFAPAALESMLVIARSGVPHVFRTTFVEHLLTEADMKAIEALIPEGSRHVRQPYRKPN